MTTIDRIRRVAALGLVAAAGVEFEADARAQGASGSHVGAAPVVSQLGVGPVVPRFGVGNVAPTPPPPLGYHRPFNSYASGGPLGFGFGMGFSGYGYSGMYGGSYGGLGASLPPTPELGPGTYRAGNQFADPSAGTGQGAGGQADPNGAAGKNARRRSLGASVEDPFDAAAAGHPAPGPQVRSKRTRAGRRTSARKPADRPSEKPEVRASDAGPNRPEAQDVRDRAPAATPEEPAAPARAEGARPASRPRSMLGSPR